MTTQTTDPRPLYREALAWTAGLIDKVREDQLAASTPCADFDVRTLLGHLVATVERARVIGEGGNPSTISLVVTDFSDGDYAAAYRSAIERMWPAWSDDRLDADVRAPWGTVPGRAAVWGYINETLVHGWDIAVATGQHSETGPALAEAALAVARQAIPAEVRGGHVPFAEVVDPQPAAGPTERLANWSGRKSF